MSEGVRVPPFTLHDKSIVLSLAEDVKAVADVTAHVSTQRDLIAAAQVLLETIDTAYAMDAEIDRLHRILDSAVPGWRAEKALQL